jgi:hypothetical protein
LCNLFTENPRVGGSTEARSADRRTKCEPAKPAFHSAPDHQNHKVRVDPRNGTYDFRDISIPREIYLSPSRRHCNNVTPR